MEIKINIEYIKEHCKTISDLIKLQGGKTNDYRNNKTSSNF